MMGKGGAPRRRKKTTRQPERPSVLLMDNGSLRPTAIRKLRGLAAALGRRLGWKVEPVSLLHSNAVPAGKLGGRKAEILESAVLRRAEKAGVRDFVIVPLFFGRSRALTQYIPERLALWKETYPDLHVRLAAPFAAAGDERLARLLEEQVRAKLTPNFLRGEKAQVVLVDHGSPAKAVTQVRNRLAGQLCRRLGRSVARVAASSMERRPGAAYAFNEPLLENLLATTPWNAGPVVVAQLFLLPGRHAGPAGDIAAICRRAREKHPRLRTVRTRLLGDHPGLIEILADRFHAAVRRR
jgi:sirohydrochlorin ferrochelatase